MEKQYAPLIGHKKWGAVSYKKKNSQFSFKKQSKNLIQDQNERESPKLKG